MADPLRPYGGENGADRVKRRRATLVDAALDILGSPDGGLISVRGVCRQAGLTARYFYESFEDVDALVAATYDEVVLDIATAAQEAALAGGRSTRDQIASVVRVIVDRIDADRRRGRVLFSQTLLSGKLASKRMDTILMFAALTMQNSGAEDNGPEVQGAAHFYVGGFGQVLSAWIDGRIDCSTDELIDLCVTMMYGAVSELLPQRAEQHH